MEQDQLLSQVVERLQTDFGFVDANVYLLNEEKELFLVAEGEESSASHSVNHKKLDEKRIAKSVINKNESELLFFSDSNLELDSITLLSMPILKGKESIGVLNVYKLKEGSIAQEDEDLVESIANQLGIALQNAQSFAQLVDEKLSEVQRKEEAERQLEAYRNSPLGKAERKAVQLLDAKDESFLMIYNFATEVGQNSHEKPVLENLPQALATLSNELPSSDGVEITILQNVVEGFDYLLSGQEMSELFHIGLRTITTNLARPETANWEGALSALSVYRWSMEALGTESIEQIAGLSFAPLTKNRATILVELTQALLLLQTVQKTCHVYLRVQEVRDKVAYLVTAVEQLRKIERSLRNALGNLERTILERITEQWLTVTTTAMSGLQTQAKLSYELVTKNSWLNDVVDLTFSIKNNGRGVALNIRIQVAESEHYAILEGEKKLERLAPGEDLQVVLRLRPTFENGDAQFRVLFHIQYLDSRGTDQPENFADIVYLMKAEGTFQFIPNPFVVGTPLDADSALFFGRQSLFNGIKEDLTSTRKHNLVLIGQRRMGKTSLLKQLQTRLEETTIPVYLDGQAMALDPGMAGFFLNIATEIAFALEDQGIELELPQIADFEKSPAVQFERNFLKSTLERITGKHLLILFDEFEELESAVRRGNLDSTVFGFLRHLMQHYKNLSFVFCGTHRLEELAADYWSVLFNISLYHHVSSLLQEEAYQLIQEPTAQFGLRYDDLSLEKIWRLTSGHPYFLQLLCHSLVNRHNRLEKTYMTIADVNAALEEILSSGEAHFIYLWNESTSNEKLVLFAIGRTMPLTGRITPIQVTDFWKERGKTVEIQAFRQALHQLELREILEGEDVFELEGDNYYRWRLGLVGLWVEKYKSSSRVWDEVSE